MTANAKIITASGKTSKATLPKVIKNTFKGYVVFHREGRGVPSYLGQFGFDWMDLKKQDYKNNVGKHKYKNIAGSSPAADDYHFDASSNSDQFNKLEKEYNPINIPAYSAANGGSKYYVPWFSSFKDDIHELYVEIKITTAGAGIIKFECSDANIDLSGKQYNTEKKAKGTYHEKIKIKFKLKSGVHQSISSHATIEAKYYDKGKKNPAGEVIGAINVFKNNIEYKIKLKYIKVFIKGSIKVDGFKENLVLDPIGKAYTHYNNKITALNKKITTTIPNELTALNTELTNVKADPPGWYNPISRSVADVESDIKEKKKELTDAKKELVEVNKRFTEAKAIDTAQNANIASSLRKVTAKNTLIKNLFGQALVRYNNLGDTNLVIEASDYKQALDLTDEIEIYKSGGYRVRYTDGLFSTTYDTAEYRDRTFAAYTGAKTDENYIFMVSFDMHTNKTHNYNLIGKAECVEHRGNKAIMMPKADADTVVHEIGHVFNLHHTFSNSHINFCRGTIENLMDYDYLAQTPPASAKAVKKKRTFFKWQWEIIHNDPNLTKKTV